jgi:hypothetical protein
MTLVLSILLVLALAATFIMLKRRRDRQQITNYSISAEELHANPRLRA